jgi:hypothetical protein
MPPSLTDSAACPGLELPRCKLLANPAAVAYVLVLYVHKTPSLSKEGMGQKSSYDLSRLSGYGYQGDIDRPGGQEG